MYYVLHDTFPGAKMARVNENTASAWHVKVCVNKQNSISSASCFAVTGQRDGG